MRGFSFQEKMSGTWRPVGRPDFSRPAQFDCVATAPDIARYLRDGFMHLTGQIRIEGLAGLAPCEGFLKTLLPLTRRLQYEITFQGDDKKTYRLRGEKKVRYLQMTRTMTFLPAQILTEDGQVIGEATLFFDLRNLPALVRSFFRSLVSGSGKSSHA